MTLSRTSPAADPAADPAAYRDLSTSLALDDPQPTGNRR
jgi:hypothetical protein